jgi:hypothetical protein
MCGLTRRGAHGTRTATPCLQRGGITVATVLVGETWVGRHASTVSNRPGGGIHGVGPGCGAQPPSHRLCRSNGCLRGRFNFSHRATARTLTRGLRVVHRCAALMALTLRRSRLM